MTHLQKKIQNEIYHEKNKISSLISAKNMLTDCVLIVSAY